MILRADNLIKQYKKRVVVNKVSVQVEQGEIVGLLGPNGAGKTTTFYMMVGMIKPNEGRIFLDNMDITDMAMYKRARAGVGYLPQEASVFRKLSVENNIKAVLEMTKLTKAEQQKRCDALLEEFGLSEKRKYRGDLLSGGERRRTEIARALAVDPKFVLLDEPFAGVDPIAVEDIQSIVYSLKKKNIGILITDHNVQETLSITDRAYLLFEGKILQQGTAEDLANDEQVRKVYLGQNFELKTGLKGQSTKQFISSLNPLELAYLLEYKYPGMTPDSKELLDIHLETVFMNKSELHTIYLKSQNQNKEQIAGKCPRCGSTKLLVISEEKVITNKYEAVGAATGDKPTYVEKVICNVCDYILTDPNRNR